MAPPAHSRKFFGWRVVSAAFALAVFGWGLGFYGPPIYLHALRETHRWSTLLISTAVTVHFLFGAAVVAMLPRFYRRFGVASVTKAGAISLSLGVGGWAMAQEPWQLFAATLVSGAGWAATGGAATNAIVAPWFVRTRPVALAWAYNGASIGGVLFSPVWIAAIGLLGFPLAATTIGLATIVTIWVLAELLFSQTPQRLGLRPDGQAPGTEAVSVTSAAARPLEGSQLWRNAQFVTLALGMAFGLFAQIGLLAHLFSVLVPAFGAQLASLAAGGATAAAIAGRMLAGVLMPPEADRRLVACANYVIQIVGSLALLWAGGTNVPLLLLGVALFGAGIGNATSLPPLIVQVEFVTEDVSRVVPLIVAMSQATYAFAPAAFGLIREFAPGVGAISAEAAPYMFIAAASIQVLAVAALLAGRPGRNTREPTLARPTLTKM